MTPRICAYVLTAPFQRLTDVFGFLTEGDAVARKQWHDSHGTDAAVVVGVHSRDELLAELKHQRRRFLLVQAEQIAARVGATS